MDPRHANTFSISRSSALGRLDAFRSRCARAETDLAGAAMINLDEAEREMERPARALLEVEPVEPDEDEDEPVEPDEDEDEPVEPDEPDEDDATEELTS